MKKEILVIILLVSAVFVSGCSENKEIKEIAIPGHGNQIYTFANDIRESLKVPANDPTGITMLFVANEYFTVVFDGSNQQDNGYFRVVLIDLGKIPIFYAYEGKVLKFNYYYYIGDTWYNETGGNITKPVFTKPVLWFLGPATGANETSLNLVNNTIYLQGTSYKNLTLAGDRLTLLVFGIDRI